MLPPLIFVLLVSGIKDAVEDRKRKKADKEENERIVKKRQNGQWVDI